MARKFTYDQEKVKELRMQVVEATLAVINDDPKVNTWSAFKREMLLKLAHRVLPDVKEMSGPDGEPIPISNVFVPNETENKS